MNKIIGIILISSILTSNSFAVNINVDNNGEENQKKTITAQKKSDEDKDTHLTQAQLTAFGERIVNLEEGNNSDEIIRINNISCGRKLLGYTARCGTIAGFTLIGSLIGYAIVAGEFDPAIASALVKLGTPIITGGTVGYGVGWGIGNYAKAKITRRI